MCKECYIDNGSPKIINKKVLKAVKLIRELYETQDGGCGGYAHIVTDDWNIGTGFIKHCLKDAKKNDYKDNLCEETRQASIKCLNHLLTMNDDEVVTALAINEKIITK